MRLTPEQARAIHDAVEALLGGEAKVYLFGSRVDDQARGGDIDLYIEVPSLPLPQLKLRLALQRRLWETLGPRRIDLLIRADDEELRPIHRDALEQGVML